MDSLDPVDLRDQLEKRFVLPLHNNSSFTLLDKLLKYCRTQDQPRQPKNHFDYLTFKGCYHTAAVLEKPIVFVPLASL
jgi:hypothetical protein